MAKYKNHIIVFILAIIIAALICNYTEGLSRDVILSTYQKLTGTSGTTIILDNKGIPITDYGDPIGKQRNPVSISQRAFDYWDQCQLGDKEAEGYFLNCADWLVKNATSYDGYMIWEYRFSWESYNMTSPWRSGMAQGQGIQVLSRAYTITKDRKYYNIAKSSLQSFYVEVKDGGVTIKEDEGWWYEEYADEGGKNPKVLNGMIFALLGIHEYYERTNDQDARILFNKGIIALKKHLSDYDTGWWTYQDRIEKLASKTYHRIHVTQMSQLYDITNDPIFKELYGKWKGYENNPLLFWSLFRHHPAKMGVAIYIANFLAMFIILELVLLSVRKRRKFKTLK